MMYLMEGSGIYYPSKGDGIPFQAGDIIQRFPGQKHKIEWQKESLMAVIVVPSQIYEALRVVSQSPVLDTPILEHYTEGELFIATCQKLRKMMSEVSDEDLLHVSNEMQLFISRVLTKTKPDSFIHKVNAYIEQHLSESISLEDLANLCEMSLANFRLKFTKLAKVSPGRYIIHKRIEKAQDMLLNSKDSVADISRQLAYADVSDFSRQFKKFVGLTPLEYRSLPES